MPHHSRPQHLQSHFLLFLLLFLIKIFSYSIEKPSVYSTHRSTSLLLCRIGIMFLALEHIYPLEKFIKINCFQKWESRLRTLTEEAPLEFLPMSAFEPVDPKTPMAASHVRPEVATGRSLTTGPTVGQHLGRPLPTGSMYRPALRNDLDTLAHDPTGSSTL